MATGSPSDVATLVLELATARPATIGEGRLVCVDGPAGSGKTTLAATLADRTGAQVVHMDDLMDGWEGAPGTGPQLESIVGPLSQGRPGSYRRFDWEHHRFSETVPVRPAPWLVIEGVGSGNPVIAGQITVLVWVEVGDALRLGRGIERDGREMEAHWRRFMDAEPGLFADHDTRARADVLADGTGTTPPRLRP